MEEKINASPGGKIKKLPILTIVLVLAIFVLAGPVIMKEFTSFRQYLPAAFSTASVVVGNQLPIASSASLNGESAITLTEGTTTPVAVTGTVTDANGCKDLASVVVKVYKGSLSSCATTNNTTCYVLTISSPSTDPSCLGSGDTDIALSSSNATLNLQYYTQADSSWKATIIPSDTVGVGTSNTSSGTVLNSLTALEVSPTISYGSVSNGSNSTGNNTATVTNTGNVAIDYNLSGADLICTTTGSIPKGDEQYSQTSFAYGAGTTLTATPTLVAANIAAQTSGTPMTATSYWQVTVPNGVSGTCSGNVAFAAVAH